MSGIAAALQPGSAAAPTCICGTEMKLVKIEPCATGDDTELRTFDCPACRHELHLMVWYDA